MRIARTPVDSHVSGKVSCDRGDQDGAQAFSLFREVWLVLRAGFVPSEGAEGRGDSGSLFRAGYRWVAVTLDRSGGPRSGSMIC